MPSSPSRNGHLSEPFLPGQSPTSPSPRLSQEMFQEAALVEQLPDLTDRIRELGLVEQYSAFKTSYTAWRKGKARGAKGEVTQDHIVRPDNVAANKGLTFRQPTVQEWLWRRTISYWICVTFFEGAIFFTLSSFMMNFQDRLGDVYYPLTTCGFLAGKVCFFVAYYFMTLEVINIEVGNGEARSENKDAFYFWPFRYRVALNKLEHTGSTPLPYIVSIVYLNGSFTLLMAFTCLAFPIPNDFAYALQAWGFLIGSFLFMAGGGLEIIQTQVIAGTWRPNRSKAFWAAVMNFFGGSLFFVGALWGFPNKSGANAYGLGSFFYLIGSSIRLNMWTHEQFGLAFLNELNFLKAPDGVELLIESDPARRGNFSQRGVIFIHLFCWCGAMSTYNVNIELASYMRSGLRRDAQLAFNEFIPWLFAHLMLAVNSAILRVPRLSPFRQLFKFTRILCVVLTANSTVTFCLFMFHKISK